MKKRRSLAVKKEGVQFNPEVLIVPGEGAVQLPLRPAPATFINRLHEQYLMDP